MWTEGVQGLDMSWPIKGWENSRCSAAVGLQCVQYLSCQVPWPASVRTRHLKIWTIRSKHPDVGMSLPIYGTNFQGKEHEEIPAILVFTRAKTGFDAFWCWKSVLNLWSFELKPGKVQAEMVAAQLHPIRRSSWDAQQLIWGAKELGHVMLVDLWSIKNASIKKT